MQRWRRRGTLAADRSGGGKRSKLAAHAERVHALLAAEPDLTLAELRDRLAADGIEVSPSAISRFLTAGGVTRKKRPSTPPSRTARTSPPPAALGARGSRS
jgi:transposase